MAFLSTLDNDYDGDKMEMMTLMILCDEPSYMIMMILTMKLEGQTV